MACNCQKNKAENKAENNAKNLDSETKRRKIQIQKALGLKRKKKVFL